MPSILAQSVTFAVGASLSFFTLRYSTSSIRVDFPDPETPVMQTSSPAEYRRRYFSGCWPRAGDHDHSLRHELTVARRQRNRLALAQVRRGERLVVREQLSIGTGEHHLAAVFARSRSQVDDVIGGAGSSRDRARRRRRYSVGAQPLQDADQPAAVARMQAHRRLVENIERVDQRRAQRRGQIDALQLAAGERARLAIEREIVRARPRRDSAARGESRRGSGSATWSWAPAGFSVLKKAAAPHRRSWRSTWRCLRPFNRDNAARRA